jgi:hexosaminidase
MKPNRLWIACISSVALLTACQGTDPKTNMTPREPKVTKPVELPPSTAPTGGSTNAALGKYVTGPCPPNGQYSADGLASLVDGRIGSSDYLDAEWLGWWYEDKPFVVTIDLGETTAIHSLGVHALTCSEVWILLPRKVEFELSTDGKNYTKLKTVSPSKKELDNEESETKILQLTGLKQSARYVRVSVERYGELPEWHSAYGGGDGYDGEAWLFVDEIMVNAK